MVESNARVVNMVNGKNTNHDLENTAYYLRLSFDKHLLAVADDLSNQK